MSDPFDLDAVVNESTAEPFVFSFGGETYELPPTLDLRGVAALEAGRLDGALRIFLGADQWKRLQASPAVFDTARFTALFERYTKHIGATPGESSASTAS